MKRYGGRMYRSREQGFTLLEMLIAVVILGILAMIIIPQFTTSSDDAKVSAVKANLSAMRSAIEVYYQQHNNVYPGVTQITGSAAGTPATCGTAGAVNDFAKQLTWYTQTNGMADSDSTKLTAPLYGPYVKGGTLPVNPFNNRNDVVCDDTVTDVDASKRTADGTTGWKFYMKTGMLIANDGLKSNDIEHVTY